MVKEANALCEVTGKLCPSKGNLIVFETNTNRYVFDIDLPLDGRAELSPDGRHLAAFKNGKLEVFDLR